MNLQFINLLLVMSFIFQEHKRSVCKTTTNDVFQNNKLILNSNIVHNFQNITLNTRSIWFILFHINNCLPISIVESVWLQKLGLHFYPSCFSHQKVVHLKDILLELFEKMKELHALLALVKYSSTIFNFYF